MFDKDSFKKGQFNNAIFTAEKKDYIPIWSNECVLNIKYNKADNHFDLLNSEVNLKNAYNEVRKCS